MELGKISEFIQILILFGVNTEILQTKKLHIRTFFKRYKI